MTLTLIILYFIFSVLSLGKLKYKIDEKIIFYFSFLIIFLLIVFRNGAHCPDYLNYVYFFDNINSTDYSIEFSLKAIINFLHYFNFSSLSLFFVYGLIGLGIKYNFFSKDNYPFIAILGYISYELPNQEMTAIRAGVATGFVLLAILYYGKDNRKFFLYGALATFFHYSAIVFIGYPIMELFKTRYKLLFVFVISLLLPFVVGKVFYAFLGILQIPFLQAKLHQYAMNTNTISNTFRMSSFLRYLVFLSLWWKADLIEKKNPDIYKHLTILVTGIFLNSLFSFSSTFQYRFSSIFYTIEIFLYKNYIYMIKEKLFAKLFIIFLCGIDLFYLLFSVNIFGGY